MTHPPRQFSRLLLVLCALLAITPIPPAFANHLDERNVNAVHLAVLVWHPHPDAKGDPYGIPYEEGNQTADWMALRYGAYWFPTAAFDGVTILEQTPQGEGGGPFLETYANYLRAYTDRVRLDTPVTLRIDALLTPTSLQAHVNATSSLPLDERGLVLRAALFEDDVDYDGGNGVQNHRFVARAGPQTTPLDLTRDAAASQAFEVPLDPAWAAERIGLVVWVQNEDETSARFQDKEVLQAAAWSARQDGPTVQANKAVLVELYSATWCEACPPGDQAVDELANEYGISSARLHERAFAYLRYDGPWPLVASLAFGLLAAAALWPRRPPTAPRDEGEPR